MALALDRLFKAVEAVLAALLLGMVLMVFGNVVLRYAFNSGIVVSEELSRILLRLAHLHRRHRRRARRHHLGMDNVVAAAAAQASSPVPGRQPGADPGVLRDPVAGAPGAQHEINATTARAGHRHVDDLDLRLGYLSASHRPARVASAVAHRPRPHRRQRSWCRVRESEEDVGAPT
jgi:hypothetical protein